MIRISVINHTNGVVKDKELQEVIRADNSQIELDFRPYWHTGGQSSRLKYLSRSDSRQNRQPVNYRNEQRISFHKPWYRDIPESDSYGNLIFK